MYKKELERILAEHKRWIETDDMEGSRANLGGADLRNADLRNADLWGADLRNADLRNADLRDADLWGADLRNADLRDANLWGANLGGADLRNADLRNADLRNAKNVPFVPYSCPDVGAFIGYKKAWVGKDPPTPAIVELEIMADARRCSAAGRKCRCDKAKVLSITSPDVKEHYESAFSDYDASFIYKVGEIVEVKDFDKNRWNECSTGIHFFINRQEAVDYGKV